MALVIQAATRLMSSAYFGYHGTLTSNIPSIKKVGIRSGDSTVTYLADTEAGALAWAKALNKAGAKLSVIKVKLKKKPTNQVIQIPGDIPTTDIVDIINY